MCLHHTWHEQWVRMSFHNRSPCSIMARVTLFICLAPSSRCPWNRTLVTSQAVHLRSRSALVPRRSLQHGNLPLSSDVQSSATINWCDTATCAIESRQSSAINWHNAVRHADATTNEGWRNSPEMSLQTPWLSDDQTMRTATAHYHGKDTESNSQALFKLCRVHWQ